MYMYIYTSAIYAFLREMGFSCLTIHVFLTLVKLYSKTLEVELGRTTNSHT